MPMMTQRQVADDLQTTPIRARRKLERDDVPIVPLGPRSWRVAADVYEEWKRGQTESARRQAAHVVAQRVRLKALGKAYVPDFLKPRSAR